MTAIGDTVTFTGQGARKLDGRTVDVAGTFTVAAIDDSPDDPLVELRDVRVGKGDDQVLVDGNTYTVAQSVIDAPAATTSADPVRAAFAAGVAWATAQLLPAGSPAAIPADAVDAAAGAHVAGADTPAE